MAVTAQFTRQLVAMVTPEVGAEVDGEAKERQISKAEVLRELIEAGRTARGPWEAGRAQA